MNNYNIVARTEADKYHIIDVIRAARATVTGVSGYGSSYYIQMDATPAQAAFIDRMLYTSDIHNMSARQVLNAWNVGDITMNQVLIWQQRHGVNLEVCPA